MGRTKAPTNAPWCGMGIDPGGKGGISVVAEDRSFAESHRYPGDDRKTRDLVLDLRSRYNVRLCVFEKVASMPRDANRAAFTFGQNVGAWRMALTFADIPFIEVTPQKWMNAMLDSAKRRGNKTKDVSLDLARRLFPDIDLRFKADDGKAESLLMALYAIREVKQG